jgi:hypothetical protein
MFVLSFYEEADNNTDIMHLPRTRGTYGKERKYLKELVHVEGELILFLTGPGGSGKSEITKELLLYAKEFCENLGCAFTEKTILITAMTGVAATLINGETLHSGVHLLKNLANITEDMIEAFASVRLLIIDEISFAGAEDIRKLNKVLRKLLQKVNKKYGGMNIVFMGDFSQLPPVKKQKIYETETLLEWFEWINCFVELKGKWRFKDDPEYGDTLLRFRDGIPSQADFDFINSRVIKNENELPDDITYAVHANRDRDAINTATFNKYVDQFGSDQVVLILSDHVQIRSKTHGDVLLQQRTKFWSCCGESDTETSDKKRLDPVLKLYPGCKVMLTSNTHVKGGEANGSVGSVQKISLKPGKSQFQIQYGIWSLPQLCMHPTSIMLL